MSAPTYTLNIIKGKTLETPFLYSEAQLTYTPIEAVVSLAPLKVTCVSHGIIDGWPVRIQGVSSPSIMNTPTGEYVSAYVVNADTLEFNALDASLWGDITVSGNVVYSAPADITGWKFRMHIRDKVGGDVRLTFSSDPADTPDGTITVDAPNSTFTLGLSAAMTAGITWSGGVYDIEAIRPDGKVIPIIGISPVIAGKEVTVW